jgi:vacuolar-type H+-ATPase subunit F/Vma7
LLLNEGRVKLKIICVSDSDSGLLFGLLGIESYIPKSTQLEGFREEFDRFLKDPNIGLILLNEKYLLRYREYFRVVKTRKTPIIIEIPDRQGPLPAKYFEEFIQKYIGFSYIGGKA